MAGPTEYREQLLQLAGCPSLTQKKPDEGRVKCVKNHSERTKTEALTAPLGCWLPPPPSPSPPLPIAVGQKGTGAGTRQREDLLRCWTNCCTVEAQDTCARSAARGARSGYTTAQQGLVLQSPLLFRRVDAATRLNPPGNNPQYPSLWGLWVISSVYERFN